MNNSIEKLCRQYTSLTSEDIEIIKMMSSLLQPLANMEEADIFIDCPASDGDSIVVSEAKPVDVPSSYEKTVVGLLARKENEPAVARTISLGVPTKHMKAITQENRSVVQTVEPIKNGEKIIGVLIRERRLEQVQDNLESIHISDNSFEAIAQGLKKMNLSDNWLIECIEEGLILVNASGKVYLRNTAAKNLYAKMGFVEDIIGKDYKLIRLIDNDSIEDDNQGFFTEKTIGNITINVRFINLGQSGEFAILMNDVTQHKLQEKELMLKSAVISEMHHRVKNNLQMIASILRLQSRRTDNTETKNALTECICRILSMAETHQLLAQGGVDNVSLFQVLSNIKAATLRDYGEIEAQISINLTGDDMEVDSDIATALCLITNELLQNAVKYAFVGKKVGEVDINISKGDLYSYLTVTDNGCGFDISGVEMKKTLGLTIVKILVSDKLHGSMDIISDESGTIVKIEFLNQILSNYKQ